MKKSAPLVVGVAGGTGSGKTTVAANLGRAMTDYCVMIEHDSYYRDRSDLTPDERAGLNYDHPDSFESSLLATHLRDLQRGRSVEIPQYDFTVHNRKAVTRTIAPAPIIIVEGILIFADPELRDLFEIKLFVDTAADIRLLRRINRDVHERGRSLDSICSQYYETVRPMHEQFVEPSKRWADLIIPEGGENTVALDVILGFIARTCAPV